jgi:hypothetical protein
LAALDSAGGQNGSQRQPAGVQGANPSQLYLEVAAGKYAAEHGFAADFSCSARSARPQAGAGTAFA